MATCAVLGAVAFCLAACGEAEPPKPQTRQEAEKLMFPDTPVDKMPEKTRRELEKRGLLPKTDATSTSKQ
jgi:hypothetical protein